jgi:hypothetical protein
MSWSKFNAFCIDKDEAWIVAGDVGGRLSAIGVDDFKIVHSVQACAGTISAAAAHPRFPYVAALGMDHSLSVWKQARGGALTRLFDLSLRDIKCGNDAEEYLPVTSQSQALAFHPRERRLATRSGNGGLLELEFDESGVKIVSCNRIDEVFDLVTVRYAEDPEAILCGFAGGRAALAKDGKVLKRWTLDREDIHWFEHIDARTYVIASDSRRAVRLDLTEGAEPLMGEPFALDDVEHVTYNRTSRRIFASSFDRNIHEIDPQTCRKTRVAFRAPFKCRWIKTLERNPSLMIVQCRNGGLYKVDLESSRAIAVLKSTPDALWTAVKTPEKTLLLAGEGESLTELIAHDASGAHHRRTGFKARSIPLDADSSTYTKRMAAHPASGAIAFARTDGEILIGDARRTARLVKLDSAVRDIEFHPQEPVLYACCEDGHVLKIATDTGEILARHRSPLPIWSLALNSQANVLAASERMGALLFLDSRDLRLVGQESSHTYAKRMKWIDADRLLYVKSTSLWRYDLRRRAAEELVSPRGSSIEDFTWDPGRRYLVMINYSRNLILCDFESGRTLSTVPDQMDYSKGVLWLDADLCRSGYPYEFISFGRSGVPALFQVHDSKILTLGPLGAS